MAERIPNSIPEEEQVESVINTLFDHYYETRGKDSPEVDMAYRMFCHSMLDVDPVIADEIMSTAAVLCMEHERIAFAAGMKAMIRLLRELYE